MMNRKVLIIFACMFLFFYALNYLTPMSFGDDYLYSFVWQGKPMNVPLAEDAVRVSSWKALFVSQISHYCTWSGRAVSHTIAQLFLWFGKGTFNFANAFVSVLLIAEIYWCSFKGMVSCSFNSGMLFWAFFAVWAFSPDFSHVFLWLTGSCNYLWTSVILLGFLLPYVRKYYSFNEKILNNKWSMAGMFFFGIVAGCTNENSVCWVLLVLFAFIYINRKNSKTEFWMFTGVTGLAVGYLLMMLAPGNRVRLMAETKGEPWLTWATLRENAALLFIILIFFHVFLWYFNLRSFCSLRGKEDENEEFAKDVLLAKIMCAVSFCMTFMMSFSPSFPPRSAFPGTVYLIVAACILLRIQNEYAIILIKKSARKFLCAVSIIYFVITSVATFYGSYYTHEQVQEFLSFVKSSDYAKRNIIEVDSLHPVDDIVRKASWFHLIITKMSDNDKSWGNVAFSRYYGIKGIRMIQKDAKSDK